MITKFKHQATIPLSHQGDCHILGLSPDERLFIEEFYAEEYIAQYEILKHEILHSVDEDAVGENFVPIKLAPNLIIPDRPAKHPLNYSIQRFRGLREAEQIAEWLQPLSIAEKIDLLKALNWSLPPMMLLGIAESQVLAQAKIGESSFICRRLRLAYALERRLDALGLAYDYDSREIYLLHAYDADSPATPLHESLSFGGIALQRPMDLLYHNQQLFVSEGGTENTKSRVLIFDCN